MEAFFHTFLWFQISVFNPSFLFGANDDNDPVTLACCLLVVLVSVLAGAHLVNVESEGEEGHPQGTLLLDGGRLRPGVESLDHQLKHTDTDTRCLRGRITITQHNNKDKYLRRPLLMAVFIDFTSCIYPFHVQNILKKCNDFSGFRLPVCFFRRTNNLRLNVIKYKLSKHLNPFPPRGIRFYEHLVMLIDLVFKTLVCFFLEINLELNVTNVLVCIFHNDFPILFINIPHHTFWPTL